MQILSRKASRDDSLAADATGQVAACLTASREIRYHEISADRAAEAVERGLKLRNVFPHQSYFLPKCGPDGLKVAERMRGVGDPQACWMIALFADRSVLGEFPPDLFFDDDLIWHQQHMGKAGHVASANLVVTRRGLYTNNHLSDLVQRISRRRQYETRIENRFHGWHHMLLNSIANFAVENGIDRIYAPTADHALANTDPERTVGRELFDRIYDRDIEKLFLAQRKGNWWEIDVAANRERILIAEPKTERVLCQKVVAVCHDVEAGFGHEGIDDELARRAHETCRCRVERMLEIEDRQAVKATYNLVGLLFRDLRPTIQATGHCIAFHSYDHRISRIAPVVSALPRRAASVLERAWVTFLRRHLLQLARCRRLDYRIRGYRPPQSKLTLELRERNLCYHNFEWLAIGESVLGKREPGMKKRIVKVPVSMDDFALYKRRLRYEEWENRVLQRLQASNFLAVSLHDCYADHWLDQYEAFLSKLRDSGAVLKTLDEIAFDVMFASAI